MNVQRARVCYSRVMQFDAKRYVIWSICLFALACEETPPSKWKRDTQGTGEPVSAAVLERLEEHDASHGLNELEPEFRGKLKQLLNGLREQGWAARIAKGNRSVKDQLRLFDERKSRVIRGAHLCGRAVDLSLYPIGMPPPDHPFWNAKDELAAKLGLELVEYHKGAQTFVDRPHVESRRCDQADWDRLGLSEVGTFRGPSIELRMQREGDVLHGTLKVDGETRNVEDLVSSRSDSEHSFSFRGGSGTFSVRNNQRVAQPDYQAVELVFAGQTHALDRVR